MFNNHSDPESRQLKCGLAAAYSLTALLLAFSWSPAPAPAHAAERRPNNSGTTAFGEALAAFQAPAARPEVKSVGPLVITVSDLEKAVDFYTRVLSFQRVSVAELSGSDYEHLEAVFGLRIMTVGMRLGDETIELAEYLAPKGRPMPADSRSNDRWFQHIAIITSDMDRAYEKLRENHVEYASTEPQTLPAWNKNAAGIRAFYFKDPDRHVLEILQFPKDKGRPKWHRATQDLFLGIDHTAIVTGDTEASLRFYRDLLGLTVVGTSENSGTEQEHLNNVFGARLRITSLRGKDGPGIELLEYLAPTDGRNIPLDLHSNDLARWQTTLDVEDVAATAMELERAGFKLVSSGIVATPPAELGFAKACLIADPDGHVLRLVEKRTNGDPHE
jgi:catechol 2,3-dioxygenase-like lactoylglutathione lyase family enzyme